MTGLAHVSTLAAGAAWGDTRYCDIAIGWAGGDAVLYAASGPNEGSGGGIGVYTLRAGGGALSLDWQDYNLSGLERMPTGLLLADLGAGQEALLLGSYAPGLAAFVRAGNGTLTGAARIVPGGDTAGAPHLAVAHDGHVFTATQGGDAIASHAAVGGNLSQLSMTAAGMSYQGQPLTALAVAETAGGDYLLSANAVSHRVQAYAIAGNGSLSAAGHSGAELGLGIAAPTAIEVVQVAGHSYAVVSSAGSSSLSVIEVMADGTLRPVDHIIDDLHSRFQAVEALASASGNGRAFIVAGGADDGITLFELLPDGRLVGLATLADSDAMTLANVSHLAAALVGDTLQIFATSESEAGITELHFETGGLGAPILDGSSGTVMTGTPDADLIDGGAGNDTISGGNGNDIIVDGAGADRLAGGQGADTFVLSADGATERITDFNPEEDRLDLSDYRMFYGLAQLEVIGTSYGAELRFRDEVIQVYSHSGATLTAAHFAIGGVVTVSRPPQMASVAGRLIEGGAGDDSLLGTAGDDTIVGSGGADTLDGGEGFDVADYGASPVAVSLALTGGAGAGGHAQGDVLTGIEGIEGSAHDDVLTGGGADELLSGAGGADRLQGGAGDDTLIGGSGRDTLEGGTGPDTLDGGDGRDRLTGGDGDDALTSGSENDTLWGGAGTDALAAGDGQDSAYGGPGDDVVAGGAGADRVTGGLGNDSILGEAGDDLLIGHIGDDTLIGGDGDDTLSGGRYSDMLIGGPGDDRLIGHNGADTLDGGPGRDVLFGGYNGDVFVFGDGYGRDRVHDFKPGVDRLWLDDGLWGGGMSAAAMLDRYAHERHGDVVLSFGGDVLVLAGIASAETLLPDLLIF